MSPACGLLFFTPILQCVALSGDSGPSKSQCPHGTLGEVEIALVPFQAMGIDAGSVPNGGGMVEQPRRVLNGASRTFRRVPTVPLVQPTRR